MLANAGIAQLVERNLAKVEVESSRLFSRSIFKREALASLFSWFGRSEECRACLVRVNMGLRMRQGQAAVLQVGCAPMVKLVDTADLKSAAS